MTIKEITYYYYFLLVAIVTHRKWSKEKISLKNIIDTALKDYGELYELAHALRLQFEQEKMILRYSQYGRQNSRQSQDFN